MTSDGLPEGAAGAGAEKAAAPSGRTSARKRTARAFRGSVMRKILARRCEDPASLGLLLAVSLAVAAASSCRPPGDPVRATLDRAAAAARDRDAGKVLENVAADFRGADGSSRAEAAATLRQWLAAYESLDVELSDVTIERSESGAGPALARFTARLSGRPRAIGGLAGILPSTSTWRFEARLVPDGFGSEWKIAWASWSRVS